MLSREARFAIATFLTGKVNKDELEEYGQEIDDNGITVFVQRLDTNEHLVIPQEDGTAIVQTDGTDAPSDDID